MFGGIRRPWLQIGTAATALVLFGTGTAYWWSGRNAPAWTHCRNCFFVTQQSYKFAPGHMTWRVGEHVQVTIENVDQNNPGKWHMWAVGRGFKYKTTFGVRKLQSGFKTDFFAGVPVRVSHAKSVWLIKHPNNRIYGPALAGGHPQIKNLKPHSGGFFGTILPWHGTDTFDFTVPNRPGIVGTWYYACFEQDAEHAANGMIGTVTVLPAKGGV